MEQWPTSNKLPEEIIIPVPELKTNAEGKQYLTEKNGVYYDGDYLPEPPAEIDLTPLPPPPVENNPVI